jgi:flagellar basal body-associated protein FliL
MSQPPGYPPEPGDPLGSPGPPGGFPAPGHPPDAPGAGFPSGRPGTSTTPAARRRRRSLLITSIVLAVVVLLCGGGGTTAYFLIKSVGGTGKATPAAAVDSFLVAVFRDHDSEKASRLVCSESRNKVALGKKIDELRSFEQKYKSPQYSWPTPSVDSRKDNTATLTVPVKITTADERTAEKRLKFVAVKETGWWVCEVGDAK